MRHLCSELTPIESDTPFLQAATCTGPIGSSRKAGLDGLYVSPPHLHWEVSHLFPSQRLSRDFISLGLHSGPMVQACSVFLVLDQQRVTGQAEMGGMHLPVQILRSVGAFESHQ